jgi:hypothetical protein
LSARSVPGAGIFAEQVNIICRKLIFSKRPIDYFGKKVFGFDIKQNGEAAITKEAALSERYSRFGNNSLEFCNGDSINGFVLWGCADDIPDGPIIGSATTRSGTHSNQEWTAQGSVYVVVSSTWDGKHIDPHPKNLWKTLHEKGDSAVALES